MSTKQVGLPPEIIDIVIDFLHDDLQTLNICSLICRSWVHSCQYHIFSALEIGPQDLPVFLPFLNATPHIHGNVRTLRLYSGEGYRLDILTLGIILQTLNRLDFLRISGTALDLNGAVPESHIGAYSLGKLSLPSGDWCRDATQINTLHSLLRMFSYIRKLSLDYSYGIHDHASFTRAVKDLPRSPTHTPPVVDSMVLLIPKDRMPNARQPFDTLNRSPSLDSLRHLALRFRDCHGASLLADFLRTRGSTIEHLEIDLWPPSTDEQAAIDNLLSQNKLHISSCVRLRSFGYCWNYNPKLCNDLRKSHDAALSILSDASPTLREITFNLWAVSELRSPNGLQHDLAGTMDWSYMEAVLNGLPNLQSVKFVNMYQAFSQELKEYKDFILTNLPYLRVLGLFEFSRSERHPYSF